MKDRKPNNTIYQMGRVVAFQVFELASDIGINALAYKPIVKADLAKTVRKVLDKAKS